MTRSSLFDLQVNGFAGVDFQQDGLSRNDLKRAVDRLRARSMERILFTLITDDIDALCRRLEIAETHCRKDPLIGETIAGYHVEGPYLSPVPGYCGAHDPKKMRAPSWTEFRRLNEAAGGRIRLVTLAPELRGSAEFIAEARRAKVVVSIGHSQASESEIDSAIQAGATLCTHLGNGVPGQLPRHDNVIQRLLARDELTACVIPDGIHLPPFVLKNFFRAKPAGKFVLTTDAMAAADMPPGRYSVGKIEVEVGADRVVREPGKPNFAGSSLTLDDGVANAARWLGISPTEAWRLGSSAVASIFGLTLPQIP